MTTTRGATRLAAGAVAVTLAVAGVAVVPAGRRAATAVVRQAVQAVTGHEAAARSAAAKLPLRFEPNVGQVDPAVRFTARTLGGSLFLTSDEAVLSLPVHVGGASPSKQASAVVRMRLVGANRAPAVEGTERQGGVTNYLLGNDATKWYSGVPGYAGVRYDAVYPGIDLVYYGGGGGTELEYDFEVAPGADPGDIAIAFAAAGRPRLDGEDLVVPTGAGELRQPAPVLYQTVDGRRRPVDGGFVVDGTTVRFHVGDYDRTRALVIDPFIRYSTYLGGDGNSGPFFTGDEAYAVAVDPDSPNHAFLMGKAPSASFPATGAGIADPTYNAGDDVFVAKLDHTVGGGASLAWATFLGGANDGVLPGLNDGHDGIYKAYGGGIAVDAADNVYVSGVTTSIDFPTTGNAFDTSCGDTVVPANPCSISAKDTFLTKLNAIGGGPLYSTYLGGSHDEHAGGLALGAEPGTVFVSGRTGSSSGAGRTPFPSAGTPHDGASGGGTDAFVAKVDTGQSGVASLVYATHLGGSGADHATGIALDPTDANQVYIAGVTSTPTADGTFSTSNAYQASFGGGTFDAYLTRLRVNVAGSAALVYSSYLGGSGQEAGNSGYVVDLAVNAANQAVVVGSTRSADFPDRNAEDGGCGSDGACNGGHDDAFVARFDTSLSGPASVAYATFLGGGNADEATSVALDGAGSAYVAGTSLSSDFPLLKSLQAPITNINHVFVAKLTAAGVRDFATFLGTNHSDANGIAVDPAATPFAYVAGTTTGGWPTTSGANGTVQAYDQTCGAAVACGPADAFLTKLDQTIDPPVVAALSPAYGPYTGVRPVTITGFGFTGATAVNFGATAVTAAPCPATPVAPCFTVDSVNQITAYSAPRAESSGSTSVTTSTVDVTVTTPIATSPSATAARYLYGEGTVSAAGAGGCAPSCPPGDTGVRLADGRVLAIERTGSGDPPRAEVFDPATGTWAPTAACGGCGFGATLTLLQGGKVLAAGGSGAGGATAAALLYDPAAGTWTSTASMATARDNHTATLLHNGKVLVAGGGIGDVGGVAAWFPVQSAELYDPVTGAWSPAGSAGNMLNARGLHTATLLPSSGSCGSNCGKVILAGGAAQGAGQALGMTATELYDPATNTFAATSDAMEEGRYNHSALLLPTTGPCGSNCGKVLIAGGTLNYAGASATAELYDPVTNSNNNKWVLTGALSIGRYAPGLTVLPNGKVLVAGGERESVKAAEVYDVAAGAWRSAGNAPAGPFNRCCAIALAAGPGGGPAGCGANCGKVLLLSAGSAASLYTPRPAVSAVSPATDCAAAGTRVTITGTGLAGATAVAFGPALADRATALVPDPDSPDTKLVAVRPAHGTGTANVSVLSAGGDSANVAGDDLATNAAFPCQPQNVVGAARNGGATVTWSPPSSNGGSTVTSYTVTATAPAGGAAASPQTVNCPGGTCPPLTVTFSGLTNSLTLPGRGGYTFSVAAVTASGTGPAAQTATVFPQVSAGSFFPLAPARILDTRSAAESGGATPIGDCSPSPCAKLGSGATPNTVEVQVAGAGGVPASGAAAVVLNVTGTGPAGGAAFLKVYPCDGTEPNASNLNYTAGQTVPNAVTVKLSTSTANGCSGPGRVRITNNAGEVHAIADVAGWYADGTGVAGSRLTPLTPARLLDTRSAAETGNPTNPIGTCAPSPCAKLGAGATPNTVELQVAGQGGVPASGAAAVVLNVTATGPAGGAAFLKVYPCDALEPNASNLNYSAGDTVPNLVVVKLSTSTANGCSGPGRVRITNNAGEVHAIADVAAWYAGAGSLAGTRFTALSPDRVLDTRSAAESGNPANPIGTCTPSPCAPIGPGGVLTLTVAGAGGVPASGATSVVMNTTVTGPTAPSYLTVWPSDAAQPNASNLNYSAGQTVPNLVAVRLGADGRVKLFNAAGTTHAIADVAGWFNDGSS